MQKQGRLLMLYDPKWGKPRTFSEVLLAAADYMERHGHCPNSMTDAKGQVCILGAIDKVGGGLKAATIDALYAAGMRGIVEFNETHTKAEVVAKLREVANGVA